MVKKSIMNKIKKKMKTTYRIRRKTKNTRNTVTCILSNKNKNKNENKNENKNLPSTPERAKRVIA